MEHFVSAPKTKGKMDPASWEDPDNPWIGEPFEPTGIGMG